MEKFLSLSYYFNPYPDPAYQWTKLTFFVGVLLILGGLALAFYRRRMKEKEVLKKMLRPYPGLLQTYGVLTLFLLVTREAGIPYLSMRMWWFILLGFFLFSLLKFAIGFPMNYKKNQQNRQQNQAKNQYLPKRKR